MTDYEWVTIAVGAAGFVGTWFLGAFKLGRTVEQTRAAVKEEINIEREKIIKKIEAVEAHFDAEQRVQDHNFGEVGAAMRQYMTDLEKQLRAVEMYGRDNYVKIIDFEKALDRVSADIKGAVAEIKEDIRRIVKPSMKSE